MKKPEHEFAIRVGESEGRTQILRLSDRGVEPGELIPIPEGKPIYGDQEVVAAERRGPIYRLTPVLGKTKGPAQVATKVYRAGWDRTFSN